MGQLWEMFEAWQERHHPFAMSNRQAAEHLGMSPTAFGNWRGGLSEMPKRRNLLAFADLIGASYARVVDAALADARYLPESAAREAALAANIDRIQRSRPVRPPAKEA